MAASCMLRSQNCSIAGGDSAVSARRSSRPLTRVMVLRVPSRLTACCTEVMLRWLLNSGLLAALRMAADRPMSVAISPATSSRLISGSLRKAASWSSSAGRGGITRLRTSAAVVSWSKWGTFMLRPLFMVGWGQGNTAQCTPVQPGSSTAKVES